MVPGRAPRQHVEMDSRVRTLFLLPLLLAPLGCSAATRASDADDVGAVPCDPDLAHLVSVRDGRSGARIPFGAMLDALSAADAVFLGETHVDETTHRVELAVYDGLLARRDERVVLAMEMFERDAQPALDAYVAGEIDEEAFLARARPWSNYRTAYRRLVERARRDGRPVVGSNFPAPLRSKVASESGGAFDSLTPEERALAPRELLANTPAYWRRVDNAVRGHAAMMGPPPAADDPRLTATQSLWDNSMGEACALALDRHPGHAVLHVNGGFHSEYWDGTVRQLRLRRPDADVRTVAIVTTSSPACAEISGLPVADYVVFAEEVARDLDEGTYAAHVSRELEYRLYVPKSARDTARAPLLIWLADDGESANDALALWKQRLGDACAIAAVEAPYRETGEDLVEGGRWFWPDSFRQDVGVLCQGVSRVLGYLTRNVPVDPTRVVLAGEGTGATVAAAVTLLVDDLAVQSLALGPRRFARIKDFPLPLPELRGDAPPARKSLRVEVDPADESWWSREGAEYVGVGLATTVAVRGQDPWRAELERENAVRAALGLPARAVPADAARAHVVVGGSPRARTWARPLALERAQQGELVALVDEEPAGANSRAIELHVAAADYQTGAALPLAPGPFGGTTVVVLPAGLAPAEADAWLALQEDDPIAKKNRFHRLVVATVDGERALPVVLDELLAKKRENVLIVPAVWISDGATIRALRQSVRRFEDRMTLHWRPGLGGVR